jgi:6-phosphogluconolactonase
MKAAIIAALWSALSSASGLAATFVYVSNADDGDIGMYTLQPDGSLRAGARFKAESQITQMAVRPDKRVLVAAIGAKPYKAYSYAVDPLAGTLNLVGTGPLAASGSTA